MNKEAVLKKILTLNVKNLCLEYATGTGKTRCSLEYAKSKDCRKLLIVVPVIPIIEGWYQEIEKWDMKDDFDVTIICYRSLSKYVNEKYDCIICDECHHLSDLAKSYFERIESKYHIFLSATLKKSMIEYLSWKYHVVIEKISVYEAIENDILPELKIYKIPLELDNTTLSEEFIINPKNPNKYPYTVYMRDYWKCKKNNSFRYHIKCTETQKENAMTGEINHLKSIIESNYEQGIRTEQWVKNLYKLKCGERIKWLSKTRESHTYRILHDLKGYRTITFCGSIEQTEIMGKNAIHSKLGKKKLKEILDRFNNRAIKHITAVQILNEGCNLTDCRIGIFAFYNSSERIAIQKIGRILRHKEPIIILPYFKNTREEEIVNNMTEGFNKENIFTISIDELKTTIK